MKIAALVAGKIRQFLTWKRTCICSGINLLGFCPSMSDWATHSEFHLLHNICEDMKTFHSMAFIDRSSLQHVNVHVKKLRHSISMRPTRWMEEIVQCMDPLMKRLRADDTKAAENTHLSCRGKARDSDMIMPDIKFETTTAYEPDRYRRYSANPNGQKKASLPRRFLSADCEAC